MIINDVLFNCSLNEIIIELKRQLDVNHIPLLNSIKDSGTDIQISCPYHKGGQERNPSAGIRKSDGLFHCFACGETHSLCEVISHCFGHYDDLLGKFGWEWLIKNFLSINIENRKDIDIDLSRETRLKEPTYVPESILDSYRYTHPYMYERKLNDDVIERFDIGYDRANDCITFPVRNISGKTLFVATRSTKGKYFHYPSSVEKPVYGLYELYSLNHFPCAVYICESMIDALTLWTHKGKYAIALNGLGTSLQFKQLNEMPCREFIIATDSDEAGMKARQRLKKNLHKLLSEVILPKGRKDINECTYEEIENVKEVLL